MMSRYNPEEITQAQELINYPFRFIARNADGILWAFRGRPLLVRLSIGDFFVPVRGPALHVDMAIFPTIEPGECVRLADVVKGWE